MVLFKTGTSRGVTAVFVILLVLGSAPSLPAQPRDIGIIAPYAGFVTNEYVRESDLGDVTLNDTGLMLGLYGQWIRPESFQGNLFLYHAPDVNYSTLWGLHSNLDLYFGAGPVRDLVFGGGLELLAFNIDGGNNIESLQEFELQNTVVVPFLRAGKQFPLRGDNVDATIFPWAGAELSMQSGEISFTMPPATGGPPMPISVEEDIDERDLFGLVGLNARATLFRFLQFDVKYSLAFDDQDLKSRVSLMTNAFFTRNWGLSWRFSYMENSVGYTQYNIFGVVAMF